MVKLCRLLLRQRAEGVSLTSSTMTYPLTQKGIRRPQKAVTLHRNDRIKKKRRERGQDIILKTEAMKQTIQDPALSSRDLAMAQLADTLFSKGHQHTAAATNISFVPDGNPAVPLVAFAGRSSVGKSSLLRSLLRSPTEVGKSNRRVRRDAMNYFTVGNTFNMVDLPGFGGTSVPWANVLQYAVLLRNFCRYQPSLKMIYYCLDCSYKHGLYIQDIDMLKFMSQEIPNFTIVVTKGDQLNSTNGSTFSLQDIREELMQQHIDHPVLVTSAYRMGGIDTLRFDIVMNCLHALPTDRLTYTEAKKLSERLLSQEEMRVALGTPIEQDELALPSLNPSGALPLQASQYVDHAAAPEHSVMESKTDEHLQAAISMEKKLSNTELMRYVNETSPWRNPLVWPSSIVPSKHLKYNVMRCPQDPHNPYLYQPQFVAPRADMYFRRPNTKVCRSSQKGKYEQRSKSLSKQYTIPYFPDIVDVGMNPSPWAFVGSREAYYEKAGGRELGIRLANEALSATINPLEDAPDPTDATLSQELQKLEDARYSSIAMLTPPSTTS